MTKNLSLDPAAVERGERYSERHAKSLSQVVSDFLMRLPLEEEESDLTPAVRRLVGIAKGGADEEDYHRHLVEKYG
ncbi:MAG TPA: DUF6364 family protein [Longimicrobium sp.]